MTDKSQTTKRVRILVMTILSLGAGWLPIAANS